LGTIPSAQDCSRHPKKAVLHDKHLRQTIFLENQDGVQESSQKCNHPIIENTPLSSEEILQEVCQHDVLGRVTQPVWPLSLNFTANPPHNCGCSCNFHFLFILKLESFYILDYLLELIIKSWQFGFVFL
jgi:hypothetical protein